MDCNLGGFLFEILGDKNDNKQNKIRGLQVGD